MIAMHTVFRHKLTFSIDLTMISAFHRITVSKPAASLRTISGQLVTGRLQILRPGCFRNLPDFRFSFPSRMASSEARPSSIDALAVLRCSKAVCFDVDSTVITVEGIDEFAAFAGKKAEVAALTARAMGGSVPFEDALAARLALIKPTREMLDRFVAEHAFEFTDGVQEFMTHLRKRGTEVFLVSGGFTQMIWPVADRLGIPRGNVFANTVLFDECVARLLCHALLSLSRICIVLHKLTGRTNQLLIPRLCSLASSAVLAHTAALTRALLLAGMVGNLQLSHLSKKTVAWPPSP